jgi:uncharacterized protein RhaS with RHS repeats
MLARYYSSSLGRFLAVDPGNDTTLEDPQSWNKYAYVRNNPIGRTDPTGKLGLEGGLIQKEFQASGQDPRPTAAEGAVAARLMGKLEGAAEKTSKGAAIVKIVALVATPVLGALTDGASVPATLAIAANAGKVEAGADLVKAVAKPSTGNIVDVGVDLATAGYAKAAGACFESSKQGSREVGEAIAEGVTSAAQGIVAVGQATASAPASSGTGRPLQMNSATPKPEQKKHD